MSLNGYGGNWEILKKENTNRTRILHPDFRVFNLQQLLIDFLFVVDFLFGNFLEINALFIWNKGKGLYLKQSKKKEEEKKKGTRI